MMKGMQLPNHIWTGLQLSAEAKLEQAGKVGPHLAIEHNWVHEQALADGALHVIALLQVLL